LSVHPIGREGHEDDKKEPEDYQVFHHRDMEYLEEGPVQAEKAEDENEQPYFRISHSLFSLSAMTCSWTIIAQKPCLWGLPVSE